MVTSLVEAMVVWCCGSENREIRGANRDRIKIHDVTVAVKKQLLSGLQR
jgi:hypothetical protein